MSTQPPTRLFLDTNVFIIGAAKGTSAEKEILHWLGWSQTPRDNVVVIISAVLIDQILRVGRRLHGKEWGSSVISRLWSLNISYVLIELDEVEAILETGAIPREDAGIYVTAKKGQAECFVSTNRELVRVLAEKTGDFECLAPAEFVQEYLRSIDQPNKSGELSE